MTSAHSLTFGVPLSIRPFSHLGRRRTRNTSSCRPYPHLKTPGLSLVPPNLSPDSAQNLTYPAHFLTFRIASLGNIAQIWALNLNIESLN